jgi:hypothetical protein
MFFYENLNNINVLLDCMKIIYIESKFKKMVEDYLINNIPTVEHGGFLLGRNNILFLPLFLPNISKNIQNSYIPCENWKDLLELSKKIYKTELSIHFHTHPNNSIVSEGDIKVSMGSCYGNPLILLQYDADKKKYLWKGYEKYEEWEIIEKEESFEQFKEFYSKSLGLFNMGNIYIDQQNNILSDTNEGKIFINLDIDTYKLYHHLIKSNYSHYNKPTQTLLMKECDLSLSKLKYSIEKLRKNNLFVDILK